MLTTGIRAAALGGAALLVAASGAEAQGRPMTIADLFQVRQVWSAHLSPDGQTAAVRVRDMRDILNGEPDGPADIHLYLSTGPGDLRPFVTGEIQVSDVEWRPDGRAITFLARRAGDAHQAIYEIPVNGGEARQLFAHGASIVDHAWAPDGSAIYAVAPQAADPLDAELAERGFRARIYEEELRPNQVWRVALAGDEPQAEAFDLPGHANGVQVSADGTRLLVGLSSSPLIDDVIMNTRWHVVDAADGAVETVFETPGKVGAARFSPDGRTVAFLAGVDRSDPSQGVLHFGDARTGDYVQVEPEAEQHILDIAWQSNDAVLALAHQSTDSVLVVYGTDGDPRSRTERGGLITRAIEFHRPTGRIAAVMDAPDHPRELFIADAGAPFERWSELNPQLAGVAFGDQSVFSYTSRDGLDIDGVLITPRGRTPQGGWPLIVVVHGGPEAHESNGWLTNYGDPGHIAAGEGFATFYPNYRGSTGRGVEFTKIHQNDYAGGEFNDLVDGVNALAEAGIVNRDRVGITGGSYGGYASMCGATALSEHFAASVAFVGLSNQVSAFGTTDIPNEKHLVHSLLWPWEDNWLNLLQRSPVYHAGNAQTPTLILHGEEDPRVDPGQSLELYRHLRLRSSAPVRLVTYPGEGHGNANAAARFDYAHRMMRWMRHYLTGPGGEPPAPDLDWAALLDLEGGGDD